LVESAGAEGRSGYYLWCREGESIPTIFKGIVKIPLMLANRNIDAG